MPTAGQHLVKPKTQYKQTSIHAFAFSNHGMNPPWYCFQFLLFWFSISQHAFCTNSLHSPVLSTCRLIVCRPWTTHWLACNLITCHKQQHSLIFFFIRPIKNSIPVHAVPYLTGSKICWYGLIHTPCPSLPVTQLPHQPFQQQNPTLPLKNAITWHKGAIYLNALMPPFSQFQEITWKASSSIQATCQAK